MTHTFICDKCIIALDDTDTKVIHYCPVCGKAMRWDLNFGVGVCDVGSKGFYSSAMGVHPDQIPDEKSRHPDWEFDPDGKLHIKSFKDGKMKAKELGMELG